MSQLLSAEELADANLHFCRYDAAGDCGIHKLLGHIAALNESIADLPQFQQDHYATRRTLRETEAERDALKFRLDRHVQELTAECSDKRDRIEALEAERDSLQQAFYAMTDQRDAMRAVVKAAELFDLYHNTVEIKLALAAYRKATRHD